MLALVLVAGGVIVTQFLRSAVDYYCNVDEIGQRDGCEPAAACASRAPSTRGTVDDGRRRHDVHDLASTAPRCRCATRASRAGIFEECQPVVVHGELVGDTFEGDRVEVKHSNEYEAENADRLDEAAAESATCSPPA